MLELRNNIKMIFVVNLNIQYIILFFMKLSVETKVDPY